MSNSKENTTKLFSKLDISQLKQHVASDIENIVEDMIDAFDELCEANGNYIYDAVEITVTVTAQATDEHPEQTRKPFTKIVGIANDEQIEKYNELFKDSRDFTPFETTDKQLMNVILETLEQVNTFHENDQYKTLMIQSIMTYQPENK